MTADCRRTESLFEFADETLRPAPAGLEAAKAHLVVCSTCAERFAADLRLFAALRDVPLVPPPALGEPPRRGRRRIFLVATAAAVLLAAGLPLVLDRRTPEPPEPAFALPPGTTFTLTVSTITLDRGRRSVVEESWRYAARPATTSIPPETETRRR